MGINRFQSVPGCLRLSCRCPRGGWSPGPTSTRERSGNVAQVSAASCLGMIIPQEPQECFPGKGERASQGRESQRRAGGTNKHFVSAPCVSLTSQRPCKSQASFFFREEHAKSLAGPAPAHTAGRWQSQTLCPSPPTPTAHHLPKSLRGRGGAGRLRALSISGTVGLQCPQGHLS